jgi:hypothetical protein
MSAPTPTDEQAVAVARMAGQGMDLGTIAARFDPPIAIEQASAAVARGRHQLNQQAARPTPVERPAIRVSPPVSEGAPDRIEQVLMWAETEGPPRATGLAGRVRELLAQLAGMRDQSVATERQHKAIALLEKHLAEAKAELRRITAKGTTPAVAAALARTDGLSTQERAQIRWWARDNGYQVADRGIIARHIVEAYQAAHGDGA